MRADGTRRLYAVAPARLREVDEWLERFRGFWTERLDVLATELRPRHGDTADNEENR